MVMEKMLDTVDTLFSAIAQCAAIPIYGADNTIVHYQIPTFMHESNYYVRCEITNVWTARDNSIRVLNEAGRHIRVMYRYRPTHLIDAGYVDADDGNQWSHQHNPNLVEHTIDGESRYYTSAYYERYFMACPVCGTVIRRRYMMDDPQNEYENICVNCRDTRALVCSVSGELIYHSRDVFRLENGDIVCRRVWRERQDIQIASEPDSDAYINNIDPVWNDGRIALPPDLSYGIELETYGTDSRDMYDLLHKFKAVYDGSLSGSAAEIVSPVLRGVNGSGLDAIHETLCDIKDRYHVTTNTDCGFHLHIGVSKWKPIQIINFCNMGYRLQNYMFACQPRSRQHNRYAAKFRDNYPSVLQCAYDEWSNKRKPLKMLAYQNDYYDDSDCHYNNARYHFINVHSIRRTGTIEIRNHSGTLSYKKIQHWIRLWLSLADYVRQYDIPFSYDTIDTLDIDGCRRYLHTIANVNDDIISYYDHRIETFTN